MLRVNDKIGVMRSQLPVCQSHAAVVTDHHEFGNSLHYGFVQFHGIASHPPDLGA
ncbi:Unknown protein sequence [Pseudomonas amygdali pv. lachrymans]|nr:Unknown protein sequence [Pseudomonas amygdali pv. lachrymans]